MTNPMAAFAKLDKIIAAEPAAPLSAEALALLAETADIQALIAIAIARGSADLEEMSDAKEDDV